MPSGRNLVLTGFMGTGKTTVGRELASRLEMGFVDTDELIETRHGPIRHIFEEHGEEGFRQIEREVASELGEKEDLVISTGGKMVLDPENARSLARNGLIICLVASPEAILQRIGGGAWTEDRPLLQAEDVRQRIDDLLAERREGYQRFRQVSTDRVTPAEVAEEIIRIWTEPET